MYFSQWLWLTGGTLKWRCSPHGNNTGLCCNLFLWYRFHTGGCVHTPLPKQWGVVQWCPNMQSWVNVLLVQMALKSPALPPSCSAVDCGSLPNPANGQVILTTTTVGSIAIYDCNEGFGLLGTSTRTCQPNGNWSDEAPTCEREHWIILPMYITNVSLVCLP